MANTNANAATGGAALSSDEVRRAMGDLQKAIMSNDPAQLDRMWSDDYTFIAPDGTLYTKAQRLDSIRSGQTRTDTITFDDVKVNVYGDAAVVTSRATVKGTLMGRPQDGTSVTTIVFVKTKDGLKVVHGHASLPGTAQPGGANTNSNSTSIITTNTATNANTANR
jgi:ketosteroid isomerase-like protein